MSGSSFLVFFYSYCRRSAVELLDWASHDTAYTSRGNVGMMSQSGRIGRTIHPDRMTLNNVLEAELATGKLSTTD
jgi:hypothetical protein